MTAAAYHEAGHVAVALHYGFRVTGMSLVMDKEGGCFTYQYDDENDGDEQFFRHAVVSVAGALAEIRGWGHHRDQGAGSDYESIEQLLSQMVNPPPGGFDAVRDEAERILDEPKVWANVLELARAIVDPCREGNIADRHHMNGADILACVGGAR